MSGIWLIDLSYLVTLVYVTGNLIIRKNSNSDIPLGQANFNVNLFNNFSFFQHRIPSWPGLHIWPLLLLLAKHDHVFNHQVPHHDWCRHFPMRKLNAIKNCREKKSCNCLKRKIEKQETEVQNDQVNTQNFNKILTWVTLGEWVVCANPKISHQFL